MFLDSIDFNVDFKSSILLFTRPIKSGSSLFLKTAINEITSNTFRLSFSVKPRVFKAIEATNRKDVFNMVAYCI